VGHGPYPPLALPQVVVEPPAAYGNKLQLTNDRGQKLFNVPRTSLISDLYRDSQVLKAFKVVHSVGDFIIQVVSRETKHLELPKLADLCCDWSSYVVVLQGTTRWGKQRKTFQSKRNTQQRIGKQ
jgi:hypothetical protein